MMYFKPSRRKLTLIFYKLFFYFKEHISDFRVLASAWDEDDDQETVNRLLVRGESVVFCFRSQIDQLSIINPVWKHSVKFYNIFRNTSRIWTLNIFLIHSVSCLSALKKQQVVVRELIVPHYIIYFSCQPYGLRDIFRWEELTICQAVSILSYKSSVQITAWRLDILKCFRGFPRWFQEHDRIVS
jgi:hypothetical protein